MKHSLISRIGGWFSREPSLPVAVAVFGKSAVVNGHQDLAGDATKSLLEFARATYYEGALPNCTAWEADLRGGERVLATHLVRWSNGRLTVARVAAVAEGGATTKAFAPMIACVEIDGASGIAMMPAIDQALRSVEQSLLDARPETWGAVLAPVRSSLREQLQRLVAKASSQPEFDAVLAGHLARLGDLAKAWTESLAEELDLEMSIGGGGAARSASKGTGLRCRTAEVPRAGADIATDLRGWSAFLSAASPGLSEWWMIGGEQIASIRVVIGRPREREFAALWRSQESAALIPQPLSDSGRARVIERSGTWLKGRLDERRQDASVDPRHPKPGASG